MLTQDTLVKVTNRSDSLVGYRLPEKHIVRRFGRNESKLLTVEEIRALNSEKGGKALIKHHLIIENEELLNELLFRVEPEYYYSEKDVKELLLSGSLDQLLDALDFAPNGVKDLIQEYAVALKINDLSKREAILKKTGFDVTAAINAKEESGEDVVPEVRVRRSAPIGAQNSQPTESDTSRRVSKYKVTTISNN